MELVKTSNLKKYYRTGEICIKALDHVNLSVEEGEFIAVVGPSGCGKMQQRHVKKQKLQKDGLL